MQRCFDMPEPKFHKKLTCVMLDHSPQTIFHRKIIYNFFRIYLGRSSRPEVFCKKVFSEISQNSQENTCARVHFLIKFQASAKNEILVQVFFSEISNNTFFTELLWWLLLSGPTFMKKIIYTMLCRPWWTNIGQEYCLVNVLQIRLAKSAQIYFLRKTGCFKQVWQSVFNRVLYH